MQLYGAVASPYVTRVVLFARLQGLELDPAMPGGGVKSTAFLARNPMGRMSVLEVDGASIAESEVTCELLEDLHPRHGGLPGTPLDRARARTISRVYDTCVSPQVSVLFRSMNPATRDEATVATATDPLTSAFLARYEPAVDAFPQSLRSR